MPRPAFLDQVAESVRAELATTQTLAEFLSDERLLTRAERQTIVRQALWMLESAYVHLPQKRAMYAVEPLQRLRLLRYRLERTPEDRLPSDLEFHRELTAIFTELRDLHTNYLLPAPYRDTVAYLPFLIEEGCDEPGGASQLLVTQVLPGYARPPFGVGVEVLDWNGVPIRRALALNADRQAGSNAAARYACGLDTLTIRPLVRALPPDELWVTLGYRDQAGQRQELRQEWLVFRPASAGGANVGAAAGLTLGLDLQADQVQETRKLFFAPRAVEAERMVLLSGAPQAAPGSIETTMPTVFRARGQETSSGTFGYVRIFTFVVPDAAAFVQEFVRLVRQLPQHGLILDVRGNGGGLIPAAERLLQVLTPRRIEPARFQFICSPLTAALCRRYDDLAVWSESIVQSVETGALYSLAFPVTSDHDCNDVGQQYVGPVVLVTDAICYSATDMFAAGFRDHDIGPILGTSDNTGAGGANVWRYTDLRWLAGATEVGAVDALPQGTELRVAVRRSLRVGANAGVALEDLGIAPDAVHRLTRADLLGGNVDLLDAAGRLLVSRPVRRLALTVQRQTRRGIRLAVMSAGITRLDVIVDGRPARSLDVAGELTEVRIAVPGGGVGVVEVRGLDGGAVVASARLTLVG